MSVVDIEKDDAVIMGLEIAARILEMRLQTIREIPDKKGLFIRSNEIHRLCKSRAINEMVQSIEHVRNFINVYSLREDAIEKVSSEQKSP